MPKHAQGPVTPHTIVTLPNTNGMQLLLCYDNEGVYVNTYGKVSPQSTPGVVNNTLRLAKLVIASRSESQNTNLNSCNLSLSSPPSDQLPDINNLTRVSQTKNPKKAESRTELSSNQTRLSQLVLCCNFTVKL